MKETLELGVQTCGHLQVAINTNSRTRSESTFSINLGTSDNGKISINGIHGIWSNEAICALTGKTCVLYSPPDSEFEGIIFAKRERCPSFVLADKTYKVTGERCKCKDGGHFYAQQMREK